MDDHGDAASRVLLARTRERPAVPHQAAHPRVVPPEMQNPEKLAPLGVPFTCWSPFLARLENGSLTWTRTTDMVINSHPLYQLSYQGMRRARE